MPAGRVLSVPEILAHPQIAHRRFLSRVRRKRRAASIVTCAPDFAFRMMNPARPAPPPALSAHTERWLRHLGYDSIGIDELREQGVV